MEKQKSLFSHSTKVQIRFNDIDIMGHVNNAIHQYYFDYAKMIYFNTTLGKEIDWKETGIVLANIVIDYFAPIFLEEEIEVLTKVIKTGNKSFEIKQQIVNSKTSEIKSESISTMVCFNYYSKSSINIPNEWKEKFANFENRN